MKTLATELLGIENPIVQAGMNWASSSAALSAAVSNAGGLGVVAAGPMHVQDLREVLARMAALTNRPFAVNIPLYRSQVGEILDFMHARQVPVVIASHRRAQPTRTCLAFASTVSNGSRSSPHSNTHPRPKQRASDGDVAWGKVEAGSLQASSTASSPLAS